MAKISDKLRRLLESNPNVLKVTEKTVLYSPDFKEKAVQRHSDGDAPNKIFDEAGIPSSEFPENYCRYNLKRWKKKVQDGGFNSLYEDARGKSATGRPKSDHLDDLTRDELLAIIEIQRGVIEEVKKKRALAQKRRLKKK